MSWPLPPEVSDLIIDCLCNEPATLKACCLVSKSWVPRARKHLFACVPLEDAVYIRLWMKAFPADNQWIRVFRRIEKLYVGDYTKASLVQLHGLSPTIKYLDIAHSCLPFADIFDLVCSFPLLEDLTWRSWKSESDSDGWVAPSTSPKFTGTLFLTREIRSVARGLLALPGGLHFTSVDLICPVEQAESAMDLVSGCSETLESLCIDYCQYDHSTFPSLPDVCQYLTGGV
jgi:hypothetical protein